VALSGTLETFSLPDVLRLLSSTKKTGLLALAGDRGNGRIWVDGGDLVAAEADRERHGDIDGVLFELLRFERATFEFDTTAELPERAGAPRDVDGALDVAESRLAEWREIEAVVPSLDVRVRMVPELDGEATVTPSDWRVLARIGTGASGHDLAEHLVQGEYDVCRRLRDLVESGFVEVTDVVPEEPAAPATEEVAEAFEAMLGAPAPEIPVFEVPTEPEDEVADQDPTWSFDESELEVDADAEVAIQEEEHEQPSDLLSDLAHLSPKAAAAVEAMWGAEATDDAEPETATEEPEVAQPEERRSDLDQNLLLRFLSSSKP